MFRFKSIFALVLLQTLTVFPTLAEEYYTTVMTANVTYSELENQIQQQGYVGEVIKLMIRFSDSGEIVNVYEPYTRILVNGELSRMDNEGFESNGLIAKSLDEINHWEAFSTPKMIRTLKVWIDDCQMRVTLPEGFARYLGKKSIERLESSLEAEADISIASQMAYNTIEKGKITPDALSFYTGLRPTMALSSNFKLCSRVGAWGEQGQERLQFHIHETMPNGHKNSKSAHVVLQFTPPEPVNNY